MRRSSPGTETIHRRPAPPDRPARAGPQDSQSRTAAVELADLEDLLGQMEMGLAHFDKAEGYFLKALEHDPHRLACYDRLARLRRSELRRTEAADRTIREMISKNPDAGRAYIFRWRYAQEYSPTADAKDVQKALELAPDDPEVLLTAAVASEQKPDVAWRGFTGRRVRSSIPGASPSLSAWPAWRLGRITSIEPRRS